MFSPALLLLAACLWLTACAGSSSGSDSGMSDGHANHGVSPMADPGFSLAPPSGLQRLDAPRATSYSESDLVVEGNEYLGSEPSANVLAMSNTTQFNADWTNGLNGAAYCTYRFFVEGYDRAPVFRYGWSFAPNPVGSAWIGLANWSTNSWNWWQCDETGEFSFGNATDYIRPSDNTLFAAVVVAGSSSGELRYLRVGPSGLEAALDYSPSGGVAPVTVEFDASASTTPLGTIEVYQWDWDGDGSPDLQDTDPLETHEYSEGNSSQAILTIRNSYGEYNSIAVDLPIVSPWTHTWGGERTDDFDNVATDGEAIYVAGKTQSFGEAPNGVVLLLKYSLDGTFQWARGWSGASADIAIAMDVSPDGSIYTAGYSRSFGAGKDDLLLQRWDANGNLVWSKTWGASETDQAYGMVANSEAIYVCGRSTSFDDSEGDALIVAFDSAGEVIWDTCFGATSGSDIAYDITTSYNALSEQTTLHVVGDTLGFDSNSEVLYSTFSTAGDQLTQQTFGEGTDARGRAIAARGVVGPPEVFVVGSIGGGQDFSVLLVEVGADPLALQWGSVNEFNLGRDILLLAGSLYVCGYDGSGEDGFLCHFTTEGVLERSINWSHSEYNASFSGLARFPGRGLICGGIAYSADGEWLTGSVSTTPIGLGWESRPLTAYTPQSPLYSSPAQTALDLTEGYEDINVGIEYYEGMIAVIDE
jgi:hypothetical protein